MTQLKRRKPGEQISKTNPKASPAEEYVRSLNGDYYLLSEVAAVLGISKNTLRRLIKADPPVVQAPTFTANLGEMNFYVFSKSDIEEIRQYYVSKYEDFNSEVGLPVGRPKGRK